MATKTALFLIILQVKYLAIIITFNLITMIIHLSLVKPKKAETDV